jgi:hypothetical protein
MFGFEIFLRHNMSKKVVSKMLMKLTPGRRKETVVDVVRVAVFSVAPLSLYVNKIFPSNDVRV